MSDVSTNTPAAKGPRETIAIRDWIDSKGNPVQTGNEMDATGFRYVHLPTAKRLKADFNPETESPPDGSFFAMSDMPENVKMMCAIFGALTLAGNIVNTITNKNSPKGDPLANPIPMIEERFQDIADGTWAERGTGVGGIRYDKDQLALAIAQAKGESDPAPYLAKMDNKVDAKTGAVVANDTKGAISYGAFAMRNAAVKAKYDALTGGGTALNAL
jgi:hypothetical protein